MIVNVFKEAFMTLTYLGYCVTNVLYTITVSIQQPMRLSLSYHLSTLYRNVHTENYSSLNSVLIFQ